MTDNVYRILNGELVLVKSPSIHYDPVHVETVPDGKIRMASPENLHPPFKLQLQCHGDDNSHGGLLDGQPKM